MMKRAEFVNVLLAARKDGARIPDTLAWLRTQVREKCQVQDDRPMPKYQVDAILAYALSRNIVLTTIRDVLDQMAEEKP